MSGPMLLEVNEASKAYGGLLAVGGVCFAMREHEMVGLMGANGAGKTTLFNMVSGATKPTSGSILLRGERIDGRRPDEICRRGVGRTYQIVRPFGGMSVEENVIVGFRYGSRVDPLATPLHEAVEQLLHEVGLIDQRHRLANQLTLAARKRLEVARALATRPVLLMLDEVMAGLTPTESAAALAMLQALHQRRGIAMLIVEHNLRAMMQLCERVIALDHGRKIGEGTPSAIIENEAVIRAYLGAETA
ncbi:ABC transporter ATP-binding protein [Pigmentiphaga soli]|uniref:ABC transporter ATP-binding protein n=1 Tax=Pigmentiphaga soli TaxID=1007095 RepID=A0ABP8GUS8_9BURK